MLSIVPQVSNEQTMSSREIAEYTGKEHKHVRRDIRNMFEELELNESNFGHIYLDSRNRKQTEYLLNRELTDCLLTGYSPKARLAVIKRWHELEQTQPKLPTTFAEALQLAADQAKQLELAAPKVAFVDNLVDKNNLMNATAVAQKHGKSAIWLNNRLTEHDVYNKTIKRGRVFRQWFIDKGLGEMKQTEMGYSQALFTPKGELWIHELLTAYGEI